ncbi:TPA: hypothetical protein ACPVQN_003216 [Escherichia coli]
MVIILTDSLLSRFNKLNVPLYLHPGLPLKSVQQAYFTGFSAEVKRQEGRNPGKTGISS